ncbi:MAG: hypothetical protein AB7T31_00905 [Gemmatimonadales bacterium]
MLFALLCVGLLAPHAVAAQALGGGVRGGAGWDTRGERVYMGQLEIIEFGQWSSVEVGISALGGGTAEDYQTVRDLRTHDYHEETRVRGLTLTASLLLAHAPKDSRGPYLLFGLGLGPIDVDWRADSPTDVTLGSPRPGGGSVRTEDGVMVGTMGTAGIGMRVHRWVDLRAQGLTLLVPSTDLREDMKVVATLTFTAGLTL